MDSNMYKPIPNGTYSEISAYYHEDFANGYTVTIQDIEEHLGFRRRWITQEFSKSVKYIRLNFIATQALEKYPEEKWRYLYRAKKLYQKQSYFRFLLDNTLLLNSDGVGEKVDKIPKKMTTRQETMQRYQINDSTFYKVIKLYQVNKYLMFNCPRYELQEIHTVFSDFLKP
ncbi:MULTISPECIES: hypothetical protein [Listeria]|uniref:hypothetical protein n=1 Tax=Listeria TaxID=1637 RepID=UPI000B58B1D4|nr:MULTISPECIES: hypothetical protein [Listeria]